MTYADIQHLQVEDLHDARVYDIANDKFIYIENDEMAQQYFPLCTNGLKYCRHDREFNDVCAALQLKPSKVKSFWGFGPYEPQYYVCFAEDWDW